MSYMTIDLRCRSCEHRWDEMVERQAANEEGRECPKCGQEDGVRTPSAPAIMQRSYPDGTKRFDKLREENNAQMAMSEAKTPQDKQKIGQEIVKINRSKGNARTSG